MTLNTTENNYYYSVPLSSISNRISIGM